MFKNTQIANKQQQKSLTMSRVPGGLSRRTSTQVMISQLVSLSPVRLCADSSKPGAFFGVCVSLSLSLHLPAHSLCLKNKFKKIIKILDNVNCCKAGGACGVVMHY